MSAAAQSSANLYELPGAQGNGTMTISSRNEITVSNLDPRNTMTKLLVKRKLQPGFQNDGTKMKSTTNLHEKNGPVGPPSGMSDYIMTQGLKRDSH